MVTFENTGDSTSDFCADHLTDYTVGVPLLYIEPLKNMDAKKAENDSEVRSAIQRTISDLVSSFAYYDRKEDMVLSEAKLDEAIRTGVIALDEIVDHFKKELEKAYENT